MHAREEDEPTEGRGKSKERQSHETGSTTPQQSTREAGTRGTGQGQHPAPRHASTGTTHTAHTHTRTHGTRPAGPGSPPRGRVAGKRGRLNPDARRHPRGAQPPTGHTGHGAGAGPLRPHNRAHSTWVADRDSPPRGQASGGGGAPDPRRPSQRRTAPPPGTPFRHPHSEKRRPARARTVRLVLGPHFDTNCTRDTRVAETWLPAPEDGRPEGGTAPDTRRSSQQSQATPPGDGPPPSPRHATPTGHAGQGDSVGPPHPHGCAHSTWVADPNSPPSGRANGKGGAPDLRRPSQRWKTPPLGTPFRHPHSEQRRPARAHVVGPVLGPNARPAQPRLQHVGGGPQQPAQWAGSRERGSA